MSALSPSEAAQVMMSVSFNANGWLNACLPDEMYKAAETLQNGSEQNRIQAFEMYEKAAAQGHTLAKCKRALCYFSGMGVDQDLRKAFDLFKENAENGCSQSKFYLSYFYGYGILVPPDARQYLQLLEESAAADNPWALGILGWKHLTGELSREINGQSGFSLVHKSYSIGKGQGACFLGMCYEKGLGVDRDLARAVQLYQEGAEVNDSFALFQLAECYLQGKGVAKDLSKAFELLNKNIQQGGVQGYFHLANFYLEGTEFVAKDTQKGLALHQKAGELGQTNSMCFLAKEYQVGKLVFCNPQNALFIYVRATERGNREAKLQLGICCLKGIGTDPDPQKAVAIFQNLVSKNDVRALSYLGICSVEGRGVDQNLQTGFDLIARAAQQKDPDGLAHLGICFEKAILVREDRVRALACYKESAELGSAVGMVRLGLCLLIEGKSMEAATLFEKSAYLGNAQGMYWLASLYQTGKGVAQNPSKAAHYYRMAALNGHADAMAEAALYSLYGALKSADEVSQAISWLRKGADLQSAKAKSELGSLYMRGIQVPQDLNKATQLMMEGAQLVTKRVGCFF